MFDLYLVFSMKDFLSLVVYGIQSHHVRAATRSRPVVHCHRYSWSHRFVAVRQNRSEHRGWSQDEYRNHGKIVTCNVTCNAFYWFSGCVIYVIVNPCTRLWNPIFWSIYILQLFLSLYPKHLMFRLFFFLSQQHLGTLIFSSATSSDIKLRAMESLEHLFKLPVNLQDENLLNLTQVQLKLL